jgi:voltage-gated sodium channel
LGLIFIFEAILKIYAMHWKYFNDSWNVFDFMIVLGSAGGFALKRFSIIEGASQITIIRSFRIGRVVRLVKKYKELRKNFNTLV